MFTCQNGVGNMTWTIDDRYFVQSIVDPFEDEQAMVYSAAVVLWVIKEDFSY